MNVFYFLRRFPRRHKTANQQKVFSLAQTFLNQGHKLHFISADLSHPSQYESLSKYPINLVPVSHKRISASLSAAQVKPDLAIFNSFQMEEMYAPYMYNKWNKCPRILQINQVHGLETWRKKKYSLHDKNFLLPYDQPLYQKPTVFADFQKKAIQRSDFMITPNDFIYYLTKNFINDPQRVTLLSHGYPMQLFAGEVKHEEYRPFESRKHFVFIGDLSRSTASGNFHNLVNEIWPKIKKQLPEAELHVYSSGSWKKPVSKEQMEKIGIFYKGYVDDIEVIQRYRVMLYPARFSVGLKSKVIESWLHHTPVVTTPVGAEGMFYESLQAKYSVSQNENDSGFVNERELTSQESEGEKKVREHYGGNSLSGKSLKGLNFGGLFENYTFEQFARSSIVLYSDKKKWSECLKMGQRTLMKNQSQLQLEINLKGMLGRLELGMYNNRGEKGYDEEWKRVLMTKEYERKVYQYPDKGSNE